MRDLLGRVQRAVPSVADTMPVRGISSSFSLALPARLGCETGREHVPHLQHGVVLGRTRASGGHPNDASYELGLIDAELSGFLGVATEECWCLFTI